ncbi:hypothetical protein CC85DRAFT_280898 [Cutaneotrichosporon oleaginosum]|uniref:DUF7704 domain-containing protein n=1 Tax=Cutaneotrichosporon oleaginosum TaxID=879819 RepID=A0A0J0XBZ6_9TREE|nr:uncharacterized protein CC85DRAFT_280898 [Cutaneotrichosporon oleaginosum]KLT38596.1 hypothetical protein CC85DRAFT_280898 [Cutaneotrichosporon oleaginosum]
MSHVLPPFYFYFFWLVEPGLSVAGALYAIFRPETYAADLLPVGLERITQVVGNTLRGRMLCGQLGSCFLVLAMNSFSLFPVFRRQTPVLCEQLTRALLVPLLIGDFTHIALTLAALPYELVLEPWNWTQLIHGNVNITWGLVFIRTLWLLGVGRQSPLAPEAQPNKHAAGLPAKLNKAE